MKQRCVSNNFIANWKWLSGVLYQTGQMGNRARQQRDREKESERERERVMCERRSTAERGRWHW